MADQEHHGIEARIADILKGTLRLVAVGGETCERCEDLVDYSFKVKDGNIEQCAKLIFDLVFSAMASGDISVTTAPKRPVAFRVRDCADGWILYQDERAAFHESEQRGALMQGLYVRDGKE